MTRGVCVVATFLVLGILSFVQYRLVSELHRRDQTDGGEGSATAAAPPLPRRRCCAAASFVFFVFVNWRYYVRGTRKRPRTALASLRAAAAAPPPPRHHRRDTAAASPPPRRTAAAAAARATQHRSGGGMPENLAPIQSPQCRRTSGIRALCSATSATHVARGDREQVPRLEISISR